MKSPEPLTEDHRKLLRWARGAIQEAVEGRKLSAIPESELTDYLRSPHAAFVTLKKHGDLRGCIGQMDFEAPLWQNVRKAAVAAALEDPRFTPVEIDELPALRLEISVLEPPIVLPRLEDFDPQVHGIIVQRGWHKALLLPKVAQEYGWNAARVLETTCLKAGLPGDAWREPDTQLQIFTATDFGEEAPSETAPHP